MVLTLAVGACQDPPAPASAPAPAPATPSAAARARDAMARSDWKTAAPLFREAVASTPQDVSLHYALAVVATHLDDRDEATREFRWIVANAARDSMEYRTAATWLADAGGTASPPPAPTGATAARPAPPPYIPHVERTGDATLYGRVTWASEPGGPPSTKRMQVHLTGLPNSSTKEQRYTVRTDEEGRYEFRRIVGGPYKLSNRVAGKPTWRLRVEVEPGRDTALDLTPTNSLAARDDFPDR